MISQPGQQDCLCHGVLLYSVAPSACCHGILLTAPSTFYHGILLTASYLHAELTSFFELNERSLLYLQPLYLYVRDEINCPSSQDGLMACKVGMHKYPAKYSCAQNYSTLCSHFISMGARGWIILKILDPYLNQRMLNWYCSPSKHT